MASAGSRSSELSTRPATRRPPWYLPSRSEETSRRSRSDASEAAQGAPELLETGSGFSIVLAGSVCRAMEQEVLHAIWRFESREIESGGWLYAMYPLEDHRATVVYASGPGQNGSHGSGQVRLSEPNQVEAACGEILARARLVRVGDWHSHPVQDTIPSDADLAAWARHGEDAGVLPYAGVIVTPGEVGWMSPEFHG
jgi:proteasome lid subunit RPN8/RPN11